MNIIRPQLKTFHCVDHNPIDKWQPTGDEVFYNLTLHIGEATSDAYDLFFVTVCTPSGLRQAKQRGLKTGLKEQPIVLTSYHWDAVLDEVHRRLECCQDSDWIRVQENLRKWFDWEYEGMEGCG